MIIGLDRECLGIRTFNRFHAKVCLSRVHCVCMWRFFVFLKGLFGGLVGTAFTFILINTRDLLTSKDRECSVLFRLELKWAAKC